MSMHPMTRAFLESTKEWCEECLEDDEHHTPQYHGYEVVGYEADEGGTWSVILYDFDGNDHTDCGDTGIFFNVPLSEAMGLILNQNRIVCDARVMGELQKLKLGGAQWAPSMEDKFKEHRNSAKAMGVGK